MESIWVVVKSHSKFPGKTKEEPLLIENVDRQVLYEVLMD